MLEILIGIVEDDEGLVLHRLDRFPEFGIERIEVVDQFFGIGLIGGGIAGIGGDQRGFYRLRHGLGIFGIEPEMGVICAVVMALVTLRMVVSMIVCAFLFSVAVMRLVAFVAMVVCFKGAAFTEGQLFQTLCVFQFHHGCLAGKRFERLFQECFQSRPNPEDHIGFFELAGIGRSEIIGVRRSRAVNDELRFADAPHDGGDEGMDGLDRDHDIGRGGGAGSGGRYCHRCHERDQERFHEMHST